MVTVIKQEDCGGSASVPSMGGPSSASAPVSTPVSTPVGAGSGGGKRTGAQAHLDDPSGHSDMKKRKTEIQSNTLSVSGGGGIDGGTNSTSVSASAGRVNNAISHVQEGSQSQSQQPRIQQQTQSHVQPSKVATVVVSDNSGVSSGSSSASTTSSPPQHTNINTTTATGTVPVSVPGSTATASSGVTTTTGQKVGLAVATARSTVTTQTQIQRKAQTQTLPPQKATALTTTAITTQGQGTTIAQIRQQQSTAGAASAPASGATVTYVGTSPVVTSATTIATSTATSSSVPRATSTACATLTIPTKSNTHRPPSQQSVSTLSSSSDSSGKTPPQSQVSVLSVPTVSSSAPATGLPRTVATQAQASIQPTVPRIATTATAAATTIKTAPATATTTSTISTPSTIATSSHPASTTRGISTVAGTATVSTVPVIRKAPTIIAATATATTSTTAKTNTVPQHTQAQMQHRQVPTQPLTQKAVTNPSIATATAAATSTIATPIATTATTTTTTQIKTMQKKTTPPPPLKSTKMIHLQKKYMAQLEYMRTEFKKLERQLLGAKSTAKNLAESAGSRERREKLHSFIVHLEDTMNQIRVGCSLEVEGKCNGQAASVAVGGESAAAVAVKQEEEEAKKEFARTSALTKLTKEKEEEENVQKLEEHILANLLPVKERLTKQLAAQQGAARNPAGIPRRGPLPSAVPKKGANVGVGITGVNPGADQTQVYGQQPQPTHSALNPPSSGPVGPPAHSHFGKPLGGGSTLTKNLHGKTLGRGHGVGLTATTTTTTTASVASNQNDTTVTATSNLNTPPGKTRTVVYAGMTPGSGQVESGVSAATGVHEMIIDNPRHKHVKPAGVAPVVGAAVRTTASTTTPPPPPPVTAKFIGPKCTTVRTVRPGTKLAPGVTVTTKPRPGVISGKKIIVGTNQTPIEVKSTLSQHPATASISRPGKLPVPGDDSKSKKRVRKGSKVHPEKHRLIAQQHLSRHSQQASNVRVLSSKQPSTTVRTLSCQRKGPRTVEYICALCNESYKYTCEYNPWWALSSHECAKCGKTQIPRLDISAPSNTIEYHPALLAHAASDDNGKGSKQTVSVSEIRKQYTRPPDPGTAKVGVYPEMLGSDGEFSMSDTEDDIGDTSTPAGQAENEDFGKNYSGPKFEDYDASRLLILMAHASTCPGK